jgi:hypothetical protein
MAHSYHSTVLSTRYHPGDRVSGRTTEDSFVALDEQHIALPKLYGAPAYARPTVVVEVTERPFDPDDLPIEAVQTDEERELAASLPAHVYAPGGSRGRSDKGRHDDGPGLRPRPLSLRALAGRILGQADN